MNGKLVIKAVMRIVAIPLMMIALSLYLPDVYNCSTLARGTVDEMITSGACFQMVTHLQMTMLFVSGVLALILLFFEFYKFKHSFSKKDKLEGQ